jgi:hypothetical protein
MAKKTMKKKSAAAAAGIILSLSSHGAIAATGSTDIDISVQPIVILHYYSTVSVTVSGAELLARSFASDAQQEGSASGTGLTVDLGTALTPPTTAVDSIPLVLQNAWAVRALTNSGNDVVLDIAVDDDTLTLGTGANADVITITAATVDDGSTSGSQITFAPQGMGNPVFGDVNLTLDLTSATRAGDYEGGRYTLTATSQ